jgi:glycine C-acetyltransferase
MLARMQRRLHHHTNCLAAAATSPRHTFSRAALSSSNASASHPEPHRARFAAHLDAQLAEMRDTGTYKVERVITTPQESSIRVANGEEGEREVLNFCANNYLGLSNSPRVLAAAKRTLDTHGFGLSSVRFICGTQDIHKQLEAEVADFHAQEDAILYPSCFDANAGLFEALFTKDDAIISDALNHASIIDGVRLCKAARFRYKHMDMADLEAQLKASASARFRVIATDGVFSMDGHIAPLRDICDLADKYDALVFVDECHATGFFGKTGRGTDEYCGVRGRIDILNSTLGKAMGGATGGYTAASRQIVDILRQRSRPYLFSNTLAPAVVGASLEVFKILTESTALCEQLAENTAYFRRALTDAGFDVAGGGDGAHPIVPVMLYDAPLALRFADEMLKEGIYVIGFCYPVVSKEKARIRVQLSAAHSRAELDKCIDAFKTVKQRLGL